MCVVSSARPSFLTRITSSLLTILFNNCGRSLLPQLYQTILSKKLQPLLLTQALLRYSFNKSCMSDNSLLILLFYFKNLRDTILLVALLGRDPRVADEVVKHSFQDPVPPVSRFHSIASCTYITLSTTSRP